MRNSTNSHPHKVTSTNIFILDGVVSRVTPRQSTPPYFMFCAKTFTEKRPVLFTELARSFSGNGAGGLSTPVVKGDVTN